MIDLILGDCLEIMKTIEDNSIDAIITDPPYGTTDCKWDSVIDFDLMWEQLNRIIKPNGAIVLFGSEPFSSALRMSNIKNYKYDWVWKKNRAANFLNAKRMPLREHELISVFYKKQPTYNPQKIQRSKKSKFRRKFKDKVINRGYSKNNVSIKGGIHDKRKHGEEKQVDKELRNPHLIISFDVDYTNQFNKNIVHPTQKPIALMEYLIRTYTNEGETILDFTMGSGTTMVACRNLNRHGIGIEKDEKYFKIAQERVNSTLF